MAKPDVTGLRANFKGPHELVHTSDGKVLFVRRWDSGSASPVSVLIFHGITGYSGPYGPMIAEELAASGFNVFGMDLRGHGLSDGSRGDYPSAERLRKDLVETVAVAKARSRKVVVLGHSLGALSAVVAAKACSGSIDGLVMLSAARKVKTGVYGRPGTGAAFKTLLGVAVLRGRPLIEYRREGMIGLDDPLFNFEYSARFYSVLYGVGALKVSSMLRSGLIDSPNLRFDGKLAIPLLVGIGDHDDLFTVEAAREFCGEIDCTDKEFFVIPGARHAFFPKGSWAPLVAWLGSKF